MFLIIIEDSKNNGWGKLFPFVSSAITCNSRTEVREVLTENEKAYGIDVFEWDGKKTGKNITDSFSGEKTSTAGDDEEYL